MRWVVLLLVALFAGCAGEVPEEQEAPANLVTDPGDYSYVETDGSGWHVHDYWRGQDSLVVAETTQHMDFQYSGAGFVSYSAGPGRLPAGNVVPQGASHVNITVSWDFDADHPAPELYIKTAADAEAEKVGEPLNGVPFRFNSTNEDNDPPHQSLSGWQFLVRIQAQGTQSYDFEGPLSVTVEAHRGLEIPEWPPHPDFWQGQDRLPLFEDRQGAALLMEDYGNGGWACYGTCSWETERPDDGALVPFNAGAVEVHLEYGPGLPSGLELWYHGADSWDRIRIAPESTGTATAHFVIPVDQTTGDSPYARQSLWEFRLAAAPQPADPARWSGEYTLSAWAVL